MEGIKDRLRERLGLMPKPEYSEEAQRILDSPLVKGFFEQAQQNIIDQWKGSTDIEAREELHKFQTALQNFKAYLESFILTVGKK